MPATSIRADAGTCYSCYHGPANNNFGCALVESSKGKNLASCSRTGCTCEPPYTGAACRVFNVGVCYASGGKNSVVYSNCCSPGFSAQTSSFGVYAACQCVPEGGNYNGVTYSGCGIYTGAGPGYGEHLWCGDCGCCKTGSKCTDSSGHTCTGSCTGSYPCT